MSNRESKSNLKRFCDWGPDTVQLKKMDPEELKELRQKLGLPEEFQAPGPQCPKLD